MLYLCLRLDKVRVRDYAGKTLLFPRLCSFYKSHSKSVPFAYHAVPFKSVQLVYQSMVYRSKGISFLDLLASYTCPNCLVNLLVLSLSFQVWAVLVKACYNLSFGVESFASSTISLECPYI